MATTPGLKGLLGDRLEAAFSDVAGQVADPVVRRSQRADFQADGALATAFTSFYERCPVLRSEGETRRSRLALCDLTARVLERGLGLLGIDAPHRM